LRQLVSCARCSAIVAVFRWDVSWPEEGVLRIDDERSLVWSGDEVSYRARDGRIRGTMRGRLEGACAASKIAYVWHDGGAVCFWDDAVAVQAFVPHADEPWLRWLGAVARGVFCT